ncbi:MAG: DUF1573 domain-containing protein [Verrucomicrobiota bacterium]
MILAVSMLVIGTATFALEPPPLPPAPEGLTPSPPSSAPAAVTPPAPVPAAARPTPPFRAQLPIPAVVPPGTGAPPVATSSPTNIPGPKIQFDATIYDFGKVMSGQQVKHTFCFTNTGSQDLVLSNVQGSCGCTALGDWAHQVKPGESGQIPVVFNTANYNYPVTKFVTVVCNDKTQPFVSLQLKGIVWKPIDVSPPVASLFLRPDCPFGSVTIRITNGLEQLLLLSVPESNNRLFAAELRTNNLGREYLVIISNTAALPPGSVQGQITFKTSVTNVPVISILTWANSQPAMNIVPLRIDLTQAPLPTNQLRYVTIINNSTNPVALSEPSVDAKDANITVTESQPGRYFTVVLTFPTGFELPAGRAGSFTVKTTHPQFPLVKVPIYQPARPAPPALILKRPAPLTPAPAAIIPQPPRPLAQPREPVPLPRNADVPASTNPPPLPPVLTSP